MPSPSVVSLGRLALLCLLAWTAAASEPASANEPRDDAELEAARAAAMKVHHDQIAPFIETYCTRCHGEKKKKGGVTFEYAVKSPGASSFRNLWRQAVANLKSHDMPPEKEDKQPSDKERQMFIDWVGGMKHLSAKDPGQFVIRRLSKSEYGNTLHDLFGVDPRIAAELPDEVVGAGYTNTLSPLLMEQYLGIAGEVANRVIAAPGAAPTAVQLKLFGALPPPGQDGRTAARASAQALVRRAWRRPPTPAELDVLSRVFALAEDKGRTPAEALRLMLKAILVSPQFLFITPDDDAGSTAGKEVKEVKDGKDGKDGKNAKDGKDGKDAKDAKDAKDGKDPIKGMDIVALGDHQLAARLSYLVWGTLPDAGLSALADAGTLHDPAILAKETRRLLRDPRSRALFDGFGAQWLGLDKLADKAFDPAKFPQMTPALRAAMYDEARLLFDSVLREDRSLMTFVDCDYTYLNGTLATVYGLKDVSGEDMRKVTLADANRGGILALPGILAMTSFPNRTSPVNRGVWVLEQVLGEHVPPPPPNVPALEKQDQHQVASLTLRQRTELHRKDAVCASCHKVLDPIGFGLENFDAIGRWRDRDDSGGAIDAAGELPGAQRFSTPKELKRIISGRSGDICRALTGRLLAYALGRELEGYDEIVLDQLVEQVTKDGLRLQALVTAVVTSYPFTHRRLGEPAGASHAK